MNYNIELFKAHHKITLPPEEWDDVLVEKYMREAPCNASAAMYATEEELHAIFPKYLVAFRKDVGAALNYAYAEGVAEGGVIPSAKLIIV